MDQTSSRDELDEEQMAVDQINSQEPQAGSTQCPGCKTLQEDVHTLKTELNQFTSEKLISDKELVDVRSQLAAALKGCKELQEEVNKLKVERDQAWSTSEKLEMSNNELRDSSNAFSSQLALALKDKDTLQLQLKAMDRILEERSTKDAECIQSLESQLFQKKQQLKDLIETQDKRTPSSITSPYNSQSYSSYQKSTPGLCGLSNLGHSCYMNAALQCLNSAVPFREHFLLQFDGQDKPPGLVGAYKDLLTMMWSGAHQSLRAEQLAYEMSKICDYFDGKSSQDAQEFLGCLLENLHDNIKTAQAEPSIITKLFEGMQQSSVFCAGCETTATRDDPFMFLPIAIPEKQNYSSRNWNVQNGLEAINQEEVFEENQWCCSHCQKMPKCTRTREVIKAPEILMLHLKRFKINYLGMKQKVETPVDFPLNGLELFTSNTLSRYNLFAVINHSGSMYGGCYNAFIKHENKWYRFLDGHMSPLTGNSIVSSAAYVLFYQRVEHQEVIRKPGLCGIQNFGNTCYISAAMQSLFSLPAVQQYFMTWQKHIESSTEDVHTLIAFIHLLNDMGTGQGASSSYKKDIMCLSSGFERKAQQDSHEFIISLLDKMSKCEQRIAGKKKQQALCNGHQGPEFRGPSLIDVFQGMFLSHTECGKCLKSLNEPRHDPFTSLTVPVPNTQESVPLEDCIQMLMETPFEGVHNYWLVCYTSHHSRKVTKILTPPKVLMIHLKRFSLNGSYKEEKVDTIITFPKIINLSPYMVLPSEEVPTYELNAVINHYGTIASGHYTAYRKHEDTWYHFDDTQVTPVSGFEEVVTPVANILFYERVNLGTAL